MQHADPDSNPLLVEKVKDFRVVRVLGFVVIGLAGFLPAWKYWAESGAWQVDPFYRAGLTPYVSSFVLDSHAKVATVWSLAAVLQVFIGAKWIRVPRGVHRVLGYTLCVVGTYAFICALILEFLQFGGIRSIAHICVGLIVFAHMGLLILLARRHKKMEHAEVALCMLMWCLMPGAQRLVSFALQYLVPCSMMFFGGYEAITVALGMLLLWTRQSSNIIRVNLAFLALYLVIDLANNARLNKLLRCPHGPEPERWWMWR